MKVKDEIRYRQQIRECLKARPLNSVHCGSGTALKKLYEYSKMDIPYHSFALLIKKMHEDKELEIQKSQTKTYEVKLKKLIEIQKTSQVPAVEPAANLNDMADALIKRCAEILQQDNSAIQQELDKARVRIAELLNDNQRLRKERTETGELLRITKQELEGVRMRNRQLMSNLEHNAEAPTEQRRRELQALDSLMRSRPGTA